MRQLLNSFAKLEFDKIRLHIARYAVSDLGKEHVENLAPSSSLEEIRRNLALVSEMKAVLEGDAPPPIEAIADVRVSIQRVTIENFILSSEELHAIAVVLRTGRNVIAYFTRRKTSYPLLASLVKSIRHDNVLEYNINQTIDDDGKVKDSASKQLSLLRRQIVDKSESLKKRLVSILKGLVDKDWAQDEIITTREGRMVVPIKVEHKNQIPGFIHSTSSSGATVYVEPSETLETNNEIRTLLFEEQQEVRRILRDMTQQVYAAREGILTMIKALGELDFIQSKAKYSVEVLGAEPVIREKGRLMLRDARHPLLLQRHNREEIVPLHLEMNEEVNTLVITGPNAGGKSVVLKTVGLLNLLCQAGCHIPASGDSELRVFTDFYVDMGDEQSIENDLSSFSSHLNNMKFILDNANENSLVLIDEIGSGTDPTEGASIAASILQSLSEQGCITIVTTHHGILKTYAFEAPHFQNAAMEFDIETLRPTYRFRMGIPGSSYAVEMAQRMLLPDRVLELAKKLRGTGVERMENLIVDLERQSQALSRQLGEVRVEKALLNRSIELYTKKISTLEKEIKLLKAQAIDEAALIVKKANAAIEKVVKEIRESEAKQEVVKEARSEIGKLEHELGKLKTEMTEQGNEERLEIGDSVRLKDSQTFGFVESKSGPDEYIVLAGDLRIKVPRDELEKRSPDGVAHKGPTYSVDVERKVVLELDLRGMYGDDAINAIDKFFDDAILGGAEKVCIIHGKGTGALRKRVTEYLKSLPLVESFRLGEWNEGGSGVTIVELR